MQHYEYCLEVSEDSDDWYGESALILPFTVILLEIQILTILYYFVGINVLTDSFCHQYNHSCKETTGLKEDKICSDFTT